MFRWGGEHREDTWVGMVVGDGANGAEAREIVFVRVVEAMPGDHVEGRVCLGSSEEAASKFREQSVCGRARGVFDKRRGRSLKVAGIGQAIGPDGTKFGELEVVLVELEDVAADWAVGKRNMITDTARNHAYFIWTDEETAKLCAYVKDSVLQHYQKVTIGRVEGGVRIHGFSSGEYEHSEALLHGGITCPSDQAQRVYPVDGLVQIERIPSKLVWYLMKPGGIRVRVIGGRLPRLEGGMSSSGQYSIQPGLLIFMTRGSERGPRKLLGIQAICWPLRTIGAYWKGTLHGF